jgi:hypothetical protein
MVEIMLLTGSLAVVSVPFIHLKSTRSQPISGMVNPIAELTKTAQSLTIQYREVADNEDSMDVDAKGDGSGPSSLHDDMETQDDEHGPEPSSVDDESLIPDDEPVQRRMTIASPEPSDSSDSSGDERPSMVVPMREGITEESARRTSYLLSSH